MPTMKVYCNPYGATPDHRSRLACACPFDPDHGGGSRSYVGASLVWLNRPKAGELPPEQDEHGLVKLHFSQEGADLANAVGEADDYAFAYTHEPVDVPEKHMRYYHQQARSGSVFIPRDGKPPMKEWAAARKKAILDFKQQWLTDPDTSGWAAQFPHDAEVAAFGGAS